MAYANSSHPTPPLAGSTRNTAAASADIPRAAARPGRPRARRRAATGTAGVEPAAPARVASARACSSVGPAPRLARAGVTRAAGAGPQCGSWGVLDGVSATVGGRGTRWSPLVAGTLRVPSAGCGTPWSPLVAGTLRVPSAGCSTRSVPTTMDLFAGPSQPQAISPPAARLNMTPASSDRFDAAAKISAGSTRQRWPAASAICSSSTGLRLRLFEKLQRGPQTVLQTALGIDERGHRCQSGRQPRASGHAQYHSGDHGHPSQTR